MIYILRLYINSTAQNKNNMPRPTRRILPPQLVATTVASVWNNSNNNIAKGISKHSVYEMISNSPQLTTASVLL